MSTIKIILQARLSSSRLPGKMLMPIGGLPLCVLCAKRATQSGHHVVVATSDETSDDALCDALDEHGVKYVRGPLDDVLKRFIIACQDLDDDDLVVRLTGDNPLVDGAFVSEIIEQHKTSGARYTRSLSPIDKLPYGISAEVIECRALRALDKGDIGTEDREHVTSYLTKKGEYDLFTSKLDEDLSHLRVTVDTPEDYGRAVALFEGEQDPINVPWQALIEKLKKDPTQPRFRTAYEMKGLKPQSKLALGTVQLGLKYGVANKDGQPDTNEAKSILKTALAYGVTSLDTAAAYGSSEKVLGECLDQNDKQSVEINTKLDPLAQLDQNSNRDEIKVAVEASINNSCENLGLKKLSCVMLHRWDHYTMADGIIWETLSGLKKQGLIGKLGASVQSAEEGLQALDADEVEFVQLPFNILDYRWVESGFVEKRKKRSDVHIQARSALLQGLLLLPAEQWPTNIKDSAEEVLAFVSDTVKSHGRKSVLDLCYAYVRSQDWIDTVVVGVETQTQLLENLELFNEAALEPLDNVPRVDETVLNPAKWS